MNKQNNLFKNILGFLILIMIHCTAMGQEDSTPVVKKPLLSLRYFSVQNQIQYLVLQCNLKIDKKIVPIQNLGVALYLDDETNENNIIDRVTTNSEGKAVIYIPVKFKDVWNRSNQHKFIAITDSISELGSRQTETEITKSRLKIDTVLDSETRTARVFLEEFVENKWLPVKDAEIKLGIKRLSSVLPLGEEQTVTTDSTGMASMEFNKDSLPGDQNGNLILVAKVEDHELYGNLESETTIPWGKILITENNFNKRSLWATGAKIPIWLLSVACMVIFSVWGTLIYLVYRLFKIKKLGRTVKA